MLVLLLQTQPLPLLQKELDGSLGLVIPPFSDTYFDSIPSLCLPQDGLILIWIFLRHRAIISGRLLIIPPHL